MRVCVRESRFSFTVEPVSLGKWNGLLALTVASYVMFSIMLHILILCNQVTVFVQHLLLCVFLKSLHHESYIVSIHHFRL